MPITAVPDHVAIAVPSIEPAAARWVDGLGGAWMRPEGNVDRDGFNVRQLHYPGGAKLEILEPQGPETFAGRFVARHGAGVHHLTLKVDALLPAVDTVRAAGYDVVDVSTDREDWHQAFLRPSQVGGMIVQLAWAIRSDEEWARLHDVPIAEPAHDAALLRGPTLTNPDLSAARALWTTLGAEVAGHHGGLMVRWPDAPLDVRIDPGLDARSVGLRFAGATRQDRDPALGPAVLPSA